MAGLILRRWLMNMHLLDTCGLLAWTLRLGPTLDPRLRKELDQTTVFISSISACEIAWKVAQGKLDLGLSPQAFWRRVISLDVQVNDPDAELWFKAASLSWPHRDPADRVIVALAEQTGASLVTCDKKIIAYYPHCTW